MPEEVRRGTEREEKRATVLFKRFCVAYLCVFCMAMLLIALLPLPYSYYIILRIMVFIGAIVLSITAFGRDVTWAKWVFVTMAILFNPILPIYLNRGLWMVIDIACTLAFFKGCWWVVSCPTEASSFSSSDSRSVTDDVR